MTNSPAIIVENLEKTFTIHKNQSTTLKEMVVKNVFMPRELVKFKALDGVSFQLERGASLAIIGGNGSGKSTLLKLIARIGEPDSGRITVNGRLVAMLELGTAFQQEFTGMENIFLQCSILGLSRDQILERLDPILEFSELENFIHTPVKRYSSGMFMRLGFAIAFHVDADILILDEVLSVGDQAFQTKCKQKLRQIRREGKTILFVSHVPEHIASIADEILWLHHGTVREYGTAEEILPKFFSAIQTSQTYQREAGGRAQAALPSARHPAEKAFLRKVSFENEAGKERTHFETGEPIRLKMEVEVTEEIPNLEALAALGTLDSVRAAWVESDHRFPSPVMPGRYRLTVLMRDYWLQPALYLVSIKLGDPEDEEVIYDMHLRVHAISIVQPGIPMKLEKFERKLLPWGRFA